MYTSGSTGNPKGVAVPHRAVVRLVKQSAYVDFGPSEVFLQLAPVTFDASTLEIWGALLNGGRLVLIPPGAPRLAEVGTGLRAKAGYGSVVNGYGPTETTTFACCHRMNGETELEHGVPIGTPIGNTQVYVLGEKMELVGQGMVGE